MKTFKSGELQPVLVTDQYGRRFLDNGRDVILVEDGEPEIDADALGRSEGVELDTHTSQCRRGLNHLDAPSWCTRRQEQGGRSCAEIQRANDQLHPVS